MAAIVITEKYKSEYKSWYDASKKFIALRRLGIPAKLVLPQK